MWMWLWRWIIILREIFEDSRREGIVLGGNGRYAVVAGAGGDHSPKIPLPDGRGNHIWTETGFSADFLDRTSKKSSKRTRTTQQKDDVWYLVLPGWGAAYLPNFEEERISSGCIFRRLQTQTRRRRSLFLQQPLLLCGSITPDCCGITPVHLSRHGRGSCVSV